MSSVCAEAGPKLWNSGGHELGTRTPSCLGLFGGFGYVPWEGRGEGGLHSCIPTLQGGEAAPEYSGSLLRCVYGLELMRIWDCFGFRGFEGFGLIRLQDCFGPHVDEV